MAPGNRSLRCTGVAAYVCRGLACSYCSLSRASLHSRRFCNFLIVSKDLSDPVCSHKYLDRDAAPFFRKGVQFYENLANQMVSHQGHVLDLFASALDQVEHSS